MITRSKRGRVRGILHAQQRDLLFTYEMGVYAVQCIVHHQQRWWSDLLPGQPAGAVRGPAALQVPPELRAGGRGQERDVKFWEEKE